MSATELTMRLLRADIGVVGYCSDRVYPGRSPQGGEIPNIVVSLISEEQETILAGHQDAYVSRVSIACHGQYYNIADAIGEQVKEAMALAIHKPVFNDESPAEEIATVTAWKATTDLVDHDEERTIFRRIMDYRIRWVKP